jgi:hypothetical protein
LNNNTLPFTATELKTLATAHMAAQVEVRVAWRKLCQHDGVDPSTQFIAESEGNPFTPVYNAAMRNFQVVHQRWGAAKAAGLL